MARSAMYWLAYPPSGTGRSCRLEYTELTRTFVREPASLMYYSAVTSDLKVQVRRGFEARYLLTGRETPRLFRYVSTDAGFVRQARHFISKGL